MIGQSLEQSLQARHFHFTNDSSNLAHICGVDVAQPDYGWLVYATGGVVHIIDSKKLVPIRNNLVKLCADSAKQLVLIRSG